MRLFKMACNHCGVRTMHAETRIGVVGKAVCQACSNVSSTVSLVLCPSCQSPDFVCWDDALKWFIDNRTGQEFQDVVGYMRCCDCDGAYVHTSFQHDNHIYMLN